MSFGEGHLVEDRLHGIGFVYGPAGPGPVLGAGLEPPLVEVVPVLQRHGFVVRFLPGLDLFEQSLRQFPVRFHDRIEVAVLRFEVGDYVVIVDGRITLVPEPVIGVLHLDAVAGEGMRPAVGHGRRDRLGGLRHVGVLVAAGKGCADQRRLRGVAPRVRWVSSTILFRRSQRRRWGLKPSRTSRAGRARVWQ